MTESELKQRTKGLALRVIRLVSTLPRRSEPAVIIGRQLLRAGTSVGANYRAACRAKSRRDMIAKLGIVEEEADESVYWLELLGDAELVQPHLLQDLIREYNGILAITVASQKTLRRNETKPKR